MTQIETDEICNGLQLEFDGMKTHLAEAIARNEKDVWAEVFSGLCDIERESAEMTEDNVRKLAKYYALISQFKDDVVKYRGTGDLPLQELEKMGADRASPAEVKALWLACRYNDVLLELELKKPQLARALLSARNPESPHTLPF